MRAIAGPVPSPRRRRAGLLRAAAAAACVLAAGLLAAACASDGGGSGASRTALARPAVSDIEPGDPVSGEVAVTWMNLDARYSDVTQTLVNESSGAGQQLMSGRASSTSVRVISDADMGTLLGELRDRGFYDHATRGVGLRNIPQVPGRRGIVVVHDNGTDWGLMLTPGAGATQLPATYRDCKGLIMAVHGAVQGLEVQVNVDADRVFSKPPTRSTPRR